MSKKSVSPLATDGVRVAVDIGGTFTDLVSYDARDHVVRFEKSLSTPEALQSAVMTCFEKAQVDIARLEHFIHGSTVAINAVIQKTGARTALVTTEGFTDVYEVGRTNRPDTYNLFFEKTQPLVPGTLRFGVTERMTASIEPINGERYMSVRFGNVLGSSGSVIPTFRRQIDEGDLVPLRDPLDERQSGRKPRAGRQSAIVGDDRDVVALVHADDDRGGAGF